MPDDYNYGISVTVTDLASATIAKINKDLDKLGKQVTRNAARSEKAAKQQEQTTRAYGTQIKEQLSAKGYLNNLLKQDQAIYKQTNKTISEQGGMAKINAEIRKKGYASISDAQKKELKNTVKQIKMDRKHSVQLRGWAKSNEDDILRLNKSYKALGSGTRKVFTGMTAGMSKLAKGVHRVGMGFLTLIGPIFLVGAAMRMLQQITDAVVNPFLKFEDGLYELRKTADLTKQEMLAMGDGIEELALRIPIARTELVEIAATAGRLGITGRENILNFTEVVAMMATATVLSADESANALARVSNAFQLPIANVEYLGSIINELSNTTASNSRDIVQSIENVGASGKMLNISIDAVAAMSATLISAGMSSTRSGTRLRRFFTELARNSDKAAKAMKVSSEKMKMDIETDPTKAIMDYLKHLREIPSSVDRIVESQEIFGKVGGFAVATMAENYVDLEKNMVNARTELAFGTSLQREFGIATSKTSAQLQILDNRIEAAASQIGESFVPGLKRSKGFIAAFYEQLALMADAYDEIISKSDPMTTSLDALYDEMDRLNKVAARGEGYWEAWGRIVAEDEVRAKNAQAAGESLWDIQMKLMTAPKASIDKELPRIGIKSKEYEVEQQILKEGEALFGQRVKSLKEVDFYSSELGKTLKTVEDINIQMFDIERGLNAARKEGNDNTKEEIALMVYREDAYRRGLETVRAELQVQKERGTISKEGMKDLKDLDSLLDGHIANGIQQLSILSREHAAERLSIKTKELQNKALRDQDVFFNSLKVSVGEYADSILDSADVEAELNARSLEVVLIHGELRVVNKALADQMYSTALPLKEIIALFEEFADVPTESFDQWLERMDALHEETSNIYYAIGNMPDVLDELEKVLNGSSDAGSQYGDTLQDLIDKGFEFVITSRGIEAVHKSQLKTMKKIGTEYIHLTDKIEEMNELGQDSITIWGQLTISQSDYEDRLQSVWNLTSSYISKLRQLSDKQIEFSEASQTMPTRIQEMWRPYEGAMKRAKELAEQGKVGEANTILQGIAAEVNDKKVHASSKKQQKDWDSILRYIDDFVISTGIIPNELQEVEDELQLMQDLLDAIASKEVIITPDLNDTPFNDAMKRLLDADYVTSIRVEANLAEIKAQIEEAGEVAESTPTVARFVSPSVEKKMLDEERRNLSHMYEQVPIPFDPTKGVPKQISEHYRVEEEETSFVDTMIEGATKAGEALLDVVTHPVETVQFIVGAVNEELQKEREWVEDKWEKTTDFIGGIFGGGKALGGPISKTGLYTLHEGEHVLNKGETSHVKNVHSALGISDIVPSMKQGGKVGSPKNPLISPKEVLSKMWQEIGKAESGDLKSGTIDSMDTGGDIDETGIYQLHKGETVLTKEETNNIMPGVSKQTSGAINIKSSSNPITKAITNLQENEIRKIATVVTNMPGVTNKNVESPNTKTSNTNMQNTKTQNYNENDNTKHTSTTKNIYGETISHNTNPDGERIININIKGITLDANYDIKKFLNDMEELAMSG